MGRDSAAFLDDAAQGESHEAFKWTDKPIGTVIKGTIMDDPKSVTRDSLKDGSPEEQLPINLDTDEGPRTLWVRAGALATAIKQATSDAGVLGVAKGGVLAVKLTELRDTGKPKPAFIFKAAYTPPTPAQVDMDDVF